MKAVITFHSIDDSESILSYSPKLFDSLLQALRKSDIPILTLGKLLDNDTKEGVSITFDDGMKSLFSNALPILKTYEVPCHLFLTTSTIGKTNQWSTQPKNAPVFDMMNWAELEKFHECGATIDAHTHSHPDMRALNAVQLEMECATADALIEDRFGRRPEFFAYPYGFMNDSARAIASRRYCASFTTELATLPKYCNSAMLPRVDSYYLQSPFIQRHLDSFLTRFYLTFRGLLRKVKGSQ